LTEGAGINNLKIFLKLGSYGDLCQSIMDPKISPVDFDISAALISEAVEEPWYQEYEWESKKSLAR